MIPVWIFYTFLMGGFLALPFISWSYFRATAPCSTFVRIAQSIHGISIMAAMISMIAIAYMNPRGLGDEIYLTIIYLQILIGIASACYSIVSSRVDKYLHLLQIVNLAYAAVLSLSALLAVSFEL